MPFLSSYVVIYNKVDIEVADAIGAKILTLKLANQLIQGECALIMPLFRTRAC